MTAKPKQGENNMGYPDNFDGAACDAAQGEPVDYDQPLLARVQAVQHAAAALEAALGEMRDLGFGGVCIAGLDASEWLHAATEMATINPYDVVRDQAERDAEYLRCEI